MVDPSVPQLTQLEEFFGQTREQKIMGRPRAHDGEGSNPTAPPPSIQPSDLPSTSTTPPPP